MAYLSESHPEVFFAIPRPGGIAKIDIPEILAPGGDMRTSKATLVSRRSIRSSRSLRSGSTRSKSGFRFDSLFKMSPGVTTRDYRVTTAMVSSPWVLFDNTLHEFPKPPNPAQDVIDLLSISISTIMLLASGNGEIPNMHLKWTLSYLENIKDEYGNNPPNITGIINHIKMTNSELESFNDNPIVEPDDDKEDQTANVPAADEPPEEPPEEEAPPEA